VSATRGPKLCWPSRTTEDPKGECRGTTVSTACPTLHWPCSPPPRREHPRPKIERPPVRHSKRSGDRCGSRGEEPQARDFRRHVQASEEATQGGGTRRAQATKPQCGPTNQPPSHLPLPSGRHTVPQGRARGVAAVLCIRFTLEYFHPPQFFFWSRPR